MRVEVKNIDAQSFVDLFPPCNGCIYWEAPGLFRDGGHGRQWLSAKKATEIKYDWFKKTLKTFGRCGVVLYLDGKPVGYSQYAPPSLLPNVMEYAQSVSPPGQDAVLISCLYIRPEHQRRGLGKTLLQKVVGNIEESGCRAIETYARDDSSDNCSGPTRFYLGNGFTLVATKECMGVKCEYKRNHVWPRPGNPADTLPYRVEPLEHKRKTSVIEKGLVAPK
jgi:GNAT superfamily N-acetyltransferase